ncbi:hypothetical protein RAP15_54 [Arthrobacter phage RAP15]|uniref:Uncharacterized protein n=2 Tax=Korravirus korra TaxID=1982082 RepID=A0A0U3TM11_9CAUD|nr:hypothetical protein RAP15_54 [Arthrobacter phage RAP15]ATW58982.1 hypothetical protein PHIRE_MEGANNOLL_53 [Arthrobacter phage MeganNoll]
MDRTPFAAETTMDIKLKDGSILPAGTVSTAQRSMARGDEWMLFQVGSRFELVKYFKIRAI